jgi:DNA polymerase IV
LDETRSRWRRRLPASEQDRARRVRGLVPAPVRSRETTFQHNITARPDLENQLAALAERVAEDVAGEGRPAARVAVKVRFAPFFTHTRSVTLPAPTSDAAEITAAALSLLDKFEPGRAVRAPGGSSRIRAP